MLMKKYFIFMVMALSGAITFPLNAQRISSRLTDGWEFKQGGVESQAAWQNVKIPHDWAITGPFDRDNDLQLSLIHI